MTPSKTALVLMLGCLWGNWSAANPPRLSIESGTLLEWSTSAGNSYQLQWSEEPSGPWHDLGSSAAGDGSNITRYDPVSPWTRHYRVAETLPGEDPVPEIPLNAGFEEGTGTDPNHWAAYSSRPPIRSNTDSKGGAFCIEAKVDTGGKEGLLSQTIGDEGGSVTGGATYEFSFWAKQVDAGPSFVQQYELSWLDASGGTIGGTGLQNFSATTQNWTQVSHGAVVAPAAAVDARVRFRVATGTVPNAHGEVLIDDIQLTTEAGSGTDPVTNHLPLVGQGVSRISWPTESGVPYRPASSTDLLGWTEIDPVIIGDGGIGEFMVPLSGDKAAEFYRVSYPSGPEGPDPETGIVALFDETTVLEAPTTIDTPDALITHVADRARDRHAREGNFNAYDHYLSWYWEQRIANIEIIDRVGRNGGTDITFNYSTHDRLNPAEFRTFFRGIGTVAEYNSNQIAALVSITPSATPGETDYNYSATINENANEGLRPLQIGDRVEIELSQFLLAPRHGRNNYYGTTMLYIVGEGIVPWGQGIDLGFPGGIVGNVNRDLDSHPLPLEAWLGGKTTLPYQYSNEPEHRFKQTAGNISPTNGGPFMLGRRLHHTDFGDGSHSEPGNPAFTAHSGKLGPDLISRSCVECHVNNGRALPPVIGAPMFQTVMKVGSDALGNPHPTLGSVIQPQTTGGPAEASATIASYVTSSGQYGDGSSYSLRQPVYAFQGVTPAFFSARLAPQLVGLGLLEAIGEQTIIDLADPDDADADGISGRYQTVTDPETDDTRLGRFTSKAGQALLSHQIAAALNTDMGVTTSVFPILDDGSTAGSPELGDTELDQMTRYVALLGVGAQRDLSDPQVIAGEALFASANCTACHTPELATSPYHPMAELRNQTIHPYTDLLLHDMGPGLADNMGENGASGSEWRTPPLWSIGLTAGVSGGEAYLHDGRARTLEEAILWHGGEAEASKESFRTMNSADRAALIAFLRSL